MKKIIIAALVVVATLCHASMPDPAEWARRYRQRQEETKWQPRTFSKMKCVVALKAAGAWDQVKAWVIAANLYDEYLAAQDFKEDDPYFLQGKSAIQAQLGWTDAQVDELLAKCVATTTPATAVDNNGGK